MTEPLRLWTKDDGRTTVAADPDDAVILTMSAEDYATLTAHMAYAGAPSLAQYPSLRRAALTSAAESVLWAGATVGLEGVLDDGGWADAEHAKPALAAVESLTIGREVIAVDHGNPRTTTTRPTLSEDEAHRLHLAGAAAYRDPGAICAPGYDPAVRAYATGPVGGVFAAACRAWLHGWDAEADRAAREALVGGES